MRIKSLTYLVAALFLATACAETMQDGGAGQGSGGNQQASRHLASSLELAATLWSTSVIVFSSNLINRA